MRTALCLAAAAAVAAAGHAPAGAPAPSRWVAISEPVTSRVRTEFPGLTGGVAVDRTTGDVYMVVCGQGLWRSPRGGRAFTRVDGGAVGGRCETGFALSMDPEGRGLACFMLDGSSAITLDGGATWERLAPTNRGWDYGAVDWSGDRLRTVYAAEHENQGNAWLSVNGGRTWRLLHNNRLAARSIHYGVGVADAETLLRWRGSGGIERSADLGASWTRVSPLVPVGRAMTVFKGVCYVLGEEGLLVSRNRGLTWSVQGSTVDASWGPCFGTEASHIVVAGPRGFYESVNAGKTWKLVAPLPDGYGSTQPGWFLHAAFDPVGRFLYVSQMGKATMRLALPSAAPPRPGGKR